METGILLQWVGDTFFHCFGILEGLLTSSKGSSSKLCLVCSNQFLYACKKVVGGYCVSSWALGLV